MPSQEGMPGRELLEKTIATMRSLSGTDDATCAWIVLTSSIGSALFSLIRDGTLSVFVACDPEMGVVAMTGPRTEMGVVEPDEAADLNCVGAPCRPDGLADALADVLVRLIEGQEEAAGPLGTDPDTDFMVMGAMREVFGRDMMGPDEMA